MKRAIIHPKYNPNVILRTRINDSLRLEKYYHYWVEMTEIMIRIEDLTMLRIIIPELVFEEDVAPVVWISLKLKSRDAFHKSIHSYK